ncbi:DEAD/DEAH box helicase [Gardnerella vaginalis]|uniref:DEAD/DEAH box helicase n=1 Tax=Gardnerella vaginalis TaxID=2702 RepID=A0A2K1SU37_GARVA|nr:DEAD/DEAH box helicase [Gardnerella vaginalis]PNS43060.1 DEAD/DEAH box helicase [Gardnerella vaginalis]
MPHTHYNAHAMHRSAKKTKNAANNKNSMNNKSSMNNKTNNANKNSSVKNSDTKLSNSYNSRSTSNSNEQRKSKRVSKKRNPFEYQPSHKNHGSNHGSNSEFSHGSNHEFNSRRERNRKADKARQKSREKALQYEEMAIRDAQQDFAEKYDSSSAKQNSIVIPDSAIESRENYSENVTFSQLGVPNPIVEVLRADGKTTAFPIQQATLPDSLKGANILGRGRTGSGKTLAFSIPLVARLAENFVDLINSGKKHKSRESNDIPAPRAMILAPTRELVHQIDDVIAPLAAAYGMKTVTVYGGVRYQRQISQLKQGAQIVLACPGRLEDLIRQGALTLEKVMVSVLDEADEMADMGFLPAVTRLLEQVKPDGQRMLFSATLDKQVSAIVNQFLPNAVIHAVDDADSQVDTMTHHIFAVSAGDKYEVLRKLASGKKRSIFFTRTKYQAKNMAKKFVQEGIPAVDLQGNLSQSQRDRHLEVFSEGLVRVLVATDVAARGIDISDVALVVQTEPPEDPKSFLHRSGRTARAGEEGDVVTLVLPNQKRAAHMMLRRAGIHAKAEDVNSGSMIIDELVGDYAELQEGWTMPEPEQHKRKGRGRSRGRWSRRSRGKAVDKH